MLTFAVTETTPSQRLGAAALVDKPPPSHTLLGRCRCTCADPYGFYKVLGLLPSATSHAVQEAYAQRLKDVQEDDVQRDFFCRSEMRRLKAALDEAAYACAVAFAVSCNRFVPK